MARLYRRGRIWYVDYYDADGVHIRRSTKTDKKGEAREVLAGLLRERRLRQAGLWDDGAEAAGAAITEHADAWETSLRAKGVSDTHRRERRKHLDEFLSSQSVRSLGQLTLERGEAWIAQLRETKLSARSINKRRDGLYQFARWCVRSRRLTFNPFEALPRQNEQRNRVKVRAALTQDEARRLLEVAPRLRRLVYSICIVTGLRRSELVRMRPEHLHGLELRLPETKSGRAQSVYLTPLLVSALQALQDPAFREEVCSEARIRKVYRRGPEWLLPAVPSPRTLYRDLAKAGRPNVDPAEWVDLHALRTACATWLDELGVSPATAQAHLRHADYATTARHYTRARDEARLSAAERIFGVLTDSK